MQTSTCTRGWSFTPHTYSYLSCMPTYMSLHIHSSHTHTVICRCTQYTFMDIHSHMILTLTYLLTHTHTPMLSHSYITCTHHPDARDKLTLIRNPAQLRLDSGWELYTEPLGGEALNQHGIAWVCPGIAIHSPGKCALPAGSHTPQQLALAKPQTQQVAPESAESWARSGQAKLAAGLVLAYELVLSSAWSHIEDSPPSKDQTLSHEASSYIHRR